VLGGGGALEGSGVAAGVERDVKASGSDRPGVDGAWDEMRGVVEGLGGVGRRQVGDGDLVANAGMLLVPVRISGLAGKDLLLSGGGRGAKSESEEGGPQMHGGFLWQVLSLELKPGPVLQGLQG
jgi:hypothetical protein